MGSEESEDRLFQQRGGGTISLNSGMIGINSISDKVSGVTMCSEPMFHGSNWDAIMSLNQTGNFGNSSMVSQSEFVLENQTTGSSLVQFPSDSVLVDLVPRIPNFGSGNFSEMVTSFGHNTNSNLPYNSQDHCLNSDYGMLEASPYGKRKREMQQNAEEEEHKDPSGDASEFPKEHEEKKQSFEKNIGRSKQAKDDSSGAELSKDNYIHVRAKRGHATNSHSLAERVRRED